MRLQKKRDIREADPYSIAQATNQNSPVPKIIPIIPKKKTRIAKLPITWYGIANLSNTQKKYPIQQLRYPVLMKDVSFRAGPALKLMARGDRGWWQYSEVIRWLLTKFYHRYNTVFLMKLETKYNGVGHDSVGGVGVRYLPISQIKSLTRKFASEIQTAQVTGYIYYDVGGPPDPATSQRSDKGRTNLRRGVDK